MFLAVLVLVALCVLALGVNVFFRGREFPHYDVHRFFINQQIQEIMKIRKGRKKKEKKKLKQIKRLKRKEMKN